MSSVACAGSSFFFLRFAAFWLTQANLGPRLLRGNRHVAVRHHHDHVARLQHRLVAAPELVRLVSREEVRRRLVFFGLQVFHDLLT